MAVDVVLSSGVSRMPPVAQMAMKKKPQPARNISSVLACSAVEHPVEGAMHSLGDQRALDQAAHQQHEHRGADQQLEIRAKHVLEIARLARDVERAEPFDVRARVFRVKRIRQNAERCRPRQPLWPQIHTGLRTAPHRE